MSANSPGNSRHGSARTVVAASERAFRPYDRYGKVIAGLSWLPLGQDDDPEHITYLLRFDPGTASVPHEHTGVEEFLVLEGRLIDDDGTVFEAGTFVRFEPGTRHSSSAPDGCTVFVNLLGHNTPLAPDGA